MLEGCILIIDGWSVGCGEARPAEYMEPFPGGNVGTRSSGPISGGGETTECSFGGSAVDKCQFADVDRPDVASTAYVVEL